MSFAKPITAQIPKDIDELKKLAKENVFIIYNVYNMMANFLNKARPNESVELNWDDCYRIRPLKRIVEKSNDLERLLMCIQMGRDILIKLF